MYWTYTLISEAASDRPFVVLRYRFVFVVSLISDDVNKFLSDGVQGFSFYLPKIRVIYRFKR